MDTQDVVALSPKAAWQLSHVDHHAREGRIKPATAARYRHLIRSGETEDRLLSWIKLDGNARKTLDWLRITQDPRAVLYAPKKDPSTTRITGSTQSSTSRRVVRRAGTRAPDDPHEQPPQERHLTSLTAADLTLLRRIISDRRRAALAATETETKHCSRCDTWKPLSAFGAHPWCLDCRKPYEHAYNQQRRRTKAVAA